MQRAQIAFVVVLASALSFGIPTSVSAQSRMPENPYGRLFRGQINPDVKTPRAPEQPPQPSTPGMATMPPPMVPIAPVCMPIVRGDASIDPDFVQRPPTTGPTPLIRVIPAPPCQRSVR